MMRKKGGCTAEPGFGAFRIAEPELGSTSTITTTNVKQNVFINQHFLFKIFSNPFLLLVNPVYLAQKRSFWT